MINAKDAHNNQMNYFVKLRADVESRVLVLVEEMSASIEFHSRNGFDHLEFMPYSVSLFPSLQETRIAAEILGKIFSENGYDVLVNDYNNNSLKIQW